MIHSLFITILGALFSFAPALAAGPKPASPCRVSVTYIYKTGVKKTKHYYPPADSAAACAEAAEPYRPNASPRTVKKKTVSHRWSEP